MQATVQDVPVSRKTPWAGYILSVLPSLFLLMDGVMKLFNPQPVVETMTQLGYATNLSAGIGVVALACLVVYLIPQTAVLGAILLTGYLGGAISAHVRAGSELFSLVFPVILGALFWGGLYLRDERLRALIPVRR